MKYIYRIIHLKFLLILSVVTCFAQTENNNNIKYLTVEDGLSNNVVNSLYLDRFGFMWMGTYDGLNRYDGYDFKIFRNKWGIEHSLVNNHINVLNGDGKDHVWIGTQKGLSMFDYKDSRLHTVHYDDGSSMQPIRSTVGGIAVDNKGTAYIATDDSGLFVIPAGTGSAKQVMLNNAKNYTVRALTVDHSQVLWLFVKDVGLCRYDEKNTKIELVIKQIAAVTAMTAGEGETLWVGTERGLFQFHQRSRKVTPMPLKLSNENVMGLHLTKDHKLWIGTDGGGITIYDIPEQKVSYLSSGKQKGLLSSNSIAAIYEDKESRKWIATLRGGVNIIDHQDTQFKTIKSNPFQQNTLVNDFVLSFSEDADKNIWIGTDGGGLSIWNPEKNTYRNFVRNPALPGALISNFVTSILKDFKDDIWVATFSGGIDRFDRHTQQFKHYTCFNHVKGVDEANLWKLYEDREHQLWAGTTKGGALYRLNRNADRFELFDARLKDIHTIYQDDSGVLWAGDYTHLIKLDLVNRNHEYIPVNFAIRAIHEDRYHQLWIGTEGGGLLRYNRKEKNFSRYLETNGMPSNSILNILEDRQGNLWMSTYNGLSRFNSRSGEFKNYFATDGLQSNQFSYNAAGKLKNGQLLFGGINGFNKFDPDSIRINKRIPKIVLTGFKTNNVPIDEDPNYKGIVSVAALSEITLPYLSAVISVDFAAIEFSFQDQIKYAYYLEGWDRDWNYVDKLNTAYYSRLEEGTYKLRIKSTDTEGNWSNNEKVIEITILPPWYRSWWAYLIYLSAVAGAYVLFRLYRNRQERLKREVEQANEKIVREKELNEKKLSFFTNISHELRTPLTLIVNPIKDILNSKEPGAEKNDLNIVYRNSRRLLSLVDQLLLFRKTESENDTLKIVRLNLYQLAHEIFLCFGYVAKNNNISYSFRCDEEELYIYADRDKLEIILFNLISNALKFTPKGGTVSLDILTQEDEIMIRVSDNGSGISDDIGDKLFDKFYKVMNNSSHKVGFGIGLYLVKNFVALHKGKVTYLSKAGLGTTFIIELPKGTAAEGCLQNPAEISTGNESSYGTERSYVDELIGQKDEEDQNEPDKAGNLELLISDMHSILIIDDNEQIIDYIRQIFQDTFKIYKAVNGLEGLEVSRQYLPDIIISDVNMEGLNGIDFCRAVKEDPALSHIPVILLTGDPSPELKLEGIEVGAHDFISKPFDKELFTAKINSVIRTKTDLQSYFYNEITLKSDVRRVSEEDKGFLQKCITIIENNLIETEFNVKTLASDLGMSHSNLYKKIKATSGLSINSFIRFIKLRKAAELLINTNLNINEAAFRVGLNDMKYFREQFHKQFKLTPSEFIKKHRKSFHKQYNVNTHS